MEEMEVVWLNPGTEPVCSFLQDWNVCGFCFSFTAGNDCFQHPAFGPGAVGSLFSMDLQSKGCLYRQQKTLSSTEDVCFQAHANVFWCAAFLLLGLCYGNNISIVGNPFKTSSISLLLWRLLRSPVEQSCVAISVECDLSFLHMKQSWLMAWQSLFLIKQTVSFHSATFHSPPNKTLFCLAVQLLFYSSVFLTYIFNFQNVFPISAFPFDLCGWSSAFCPRLFL